jgi:hypothetical protein
VVEWVRCLRFWLKPGKSLAELQALVSDIDRARQSFIKLSEKAEWPDPCGRPTFHSLLHPPIDQMLFGDDCVLSTQLFEQSHSLLVKQPFRFESNHSFDNASVTRQIFDALYQRSFMVHLAAAPKRAKRAFRAGLVSPSSSTVGAMIGSFKPWKDLVAVNASALTDAVKKVAITRGTWNLMSVPSGHKPQTAQMFFYNSLAVLVGSGYRLKDGVVVKAFSGGAVSKNCVLELDGGKFALVFLIGELANAVVSNYPLLYCKALDHALRDGPICPLYQVPLLRDSDMRAKHNQILVQPQEIVRVWNAITVHTDETEFQYVFATPLDSDDV